MKAVFVNQACLLRDSHIEPSSSLDTWRLEPATVEAMRTFGNAGMLVLLWGCSAATSDGQRRDACFDALIKQVEAGGGHVDVLLTCEHNDGDLCRCWGREPGAVWVAASELELELSNSYILADDLADIQTAYAAGLRPVLVLGGRTIGAILGDSPEHSGFPIATDLTAAASYIGNEEEVAHQLGRPRAEAAPLPPTSELISSRQSLPAMRVVSAQAQAVQQRVRKTRTQFKDLSRWLGFFVLGAVGLSLGIAYILTHLYREQPFPGFVYYITLQFIPRPLRGALFIVWGLAVLALAVRSFYRSTRLNLWPKRRP
jgi:D-glycero-D-manno-heptose 1,7-bisphosphate phosphatase